MATKTLQDKLDRLVAKRERIDELVAHCVDVDQFLTASARPIAFGHGTSHALTQPGPRPALPR